MPEPAAIHEHALDNLRHIRETMERATAFTSIPGWGGAIVGVTAIVTAIVAHGSPRWLEIWLAEACLAAVIGAVSMFLKARQAHVSFAGAPARRFFLSYFAPVVAGAILTLVLPEGALPPMWLLVYGAAIVSSGTYSIPVVPIMGICFMLLGTIACFTSYDDLLLGIAFGGLHVLFGIIIARRHGG